MRDSQFHNIFRIIPNALEINYNVDQDQAMCQVDTSGNRKMFQNFSAHLALILIHHSIFLIDIHTHLATVTFPQGFY